MRLKTSCYQPTRKQRRCLQLYLGIRSFLRTESKCSNGLPQVPTKTISKSSNHSKIKPQVARKMWVYKHTVTYMYYTTVCIQVYICHRQFALITPLEGQKGYINKPLFLRRCLNLLSQNSLRLGLGHQLKNDFNKYVNSTTHERGQGQFLGEFLFF